jgi:DNA-binding NarL/FixJ family response regulator
MRHRAAARAGWRDRDSEFREMARNPGKMPSRLSSRRSLVEAAYRLDLSEQQCVDELARLATDVLDRKRPAAAFVTHNTADGDVTTFRALTSTDEKLANVLQRTREYLPPAVQRMLFRSNPQITTTSQLFDRRLMRRIAAASGATEFAGLLCPTATGVVIVGTIKSEPLRIATRDRRHWEPIAAHVSAAWRLRHALVSNANDGIVFSPEGKVLDEGVEAGVLGGPTQGLLRDAVLQRETLRSQNRDDNLWPALIAGEWTLIDRFEASGRRVVVAHRNEPPARAFHILSHREGCALQQAMDGVSNKAIAIGLKVSEATVSRLVSEALGRLRLKSLSEAAAIRGTDHTTMHFGQGRAAINLAVVNLPEQPSQLAMDVEVARLTRAERFVLTHALKGHSDRQIASARNTSRRTVANQMAAVFAKLGVRSRRELVARVLRF